MPISSTPDHEIDQSLLGTWHVANTPDSKLIIAKADPTHYLIGVRPPPGGAVDYGPLDFRGHHTKVGSVDIVNIQLLSKTSTTPGRWEFLTYTHPDADTICVRMVNDKLLPPPPDGQTNVPGVEQLTSSELMRKRFEEVIDNPELFSIQETVYKRDPLPPPGLIVNPVLQPNTPKNRPHGSYYW
ncbi:MAG: hypothetical protein QM796_15800 [Chthoniobacteraceae bacterium]